MRSGENTRGTDARWSFALGILLALAGVWVAYQEIAALPAASQRGAWFTFFGLWLVGAVAGVVVVLRSRIRRSPQEKQRYMGIWSGLLVPFVGIILIFQQFASPLVKIPTYGLLAGSTLALMTGFWIRMRR